MRCRCLRPAAGMPAAVQSSGLFGGACRCYVTSPSRTFHWLGPASEGSALGLMLDLMELVPLRTRQWFRATNGQNYTHCENESNCVTVWRKWKNARFVIRLFIKMKQGIRSSNNLQRILILKRRFEYFYTASTTDTETFTQKTSMLRIFNSFISFLS